MPFILDDQALPRLHVYKYWTLASTVDIRPLSFTRDFIHPHVRGTVSWWLVCKRRRCLRTLCTPLATGMLHAHFASIAYKKVAHMDDPQTDIIIFQFMLTLIFTCVCYFFRQEKSEENGHECHSNISRCA